MSLVSAIVNAGFTATFEHGQVVVGHRLDLQFQPYRLQRINRVAIWRPQERRGRPNSPRPIGTNNPPQDKYEYWDYLTEKALEVHQRLEDNAREREEQRTANIQELKLAMNEAWGEPKILTMRAVLEEQELKAKQDLEDAKKLREQITNPKDEV